MVGVVLVVLVLAVLQNGLRLMNTPNHVELIVMGTILMAALGIDRKTLAAGGE